MTKNTYTNIALTLQFIATATAIIIVLLPPTNTMLEITNTPLPLTTFQHKDTGIQMRFFRTADNDYYYLQSIHDHHWTWYGTPQEFAAQFQRIEEQKETNQ